ncbi:MAG: universal stress protein [Planctomycetes bacterium]|nr:universal stress protein [Planctomycetota bacterium]
MFRSVLVPLDRSSFSEAALPLALAVARRAGAGLHLAEIHDLYELGDRHAGRVPYEPERDAELRHRERLYLDATARWLALMSPVAIDAVAPSGTAVLPETVADGLLEQARGVGADLIVMATHGRGPLGRLVSGGIAHDLVRNAGVPVLLVPGGSTAGPFPEPVPEEVLIPLDGSPLAERVLEPALELAGLMEAPCVLLRVVRRGTASDEEQARVYLERVARGARREGAEVRTRVVVARDVAAAVAAEAAGRSGTLVAIATHGRGPLARLFHGSVADELVRRASGPLLVFHPVA